MELDEGDVAERSIDQQFHVRKLSIPPYTKYTHRRRRRTLTNWLSYIKFPETGRLIIKCCIYLQVRNATAVFIINLSLSDLLFGCFNLPLAASTFLRRAWVHGDFLCRLFPFFRYGLLAVSLFTILSITINRYVMIGHPRLYPRWVKLDFNSI